MMPSKKRKRSARKSSLESAAIRISAPTVRHERLSVAGIPTVSLDQYDWHKVLLTPHRRRLPFELWLLVQVVFFGSILTFFYAFQQQLWVSAVVSFGMISVWLIAWGLTWYAQSHWWNE